MENSIQLALSVPWAWVEEEPEWLELASKWGLAVHLELEVPTAPQLPERIARLESTWECENRVALTVRGQGVQAQLALVVEAVQSLGVSWLVVPWTAFPHWKKVQQAAWAANLETVAEVLQQWRKLLEDQAVSVLVDVADEDTEDPRAVVQTLAAWQEGPVRAWLDLGAYVVRFPGAQVEVALQRWFGFLGGLGLRDLGNEAALPWTVPPGWGSEVDFARVWQILSCGGFSGLVTIGAGRRRGRRKVLALQQWAEEVEQGLKHLRDCGWPLPAL